MELSRVQDPTQENILRTGTRLWAGWHIEKHGLQSHGVLVMVLHYKGKKRDAKEAEVHRGKQHLRAPVKWCFWKCFSF